jgi:lipoprotein-anchoring transpeptidase ErfK/SrfK
MQQRLAQLGKIPFPAAVGLVMVVAAMIGWGISHAFQSSPTWSQAQSSRPASRSATPQPPAFIAHHRFRYVAVAKHSQLQFYARPGAKTRMLVLANPTPVHAKLTLLVKDQKPGWVETYLPQRPNDSVAWVRKSAVSLLADPWIVVIHLHSHRLIVRRAHKMMKTFKIAVGKPSTPTPTGKYFITELLKQPDPGGAYGPYAFGTSAFSNVLQHFGTGNAQIGIHGSDQPWLIGQSISHGCIRLYNQDVVWLSKRIPLGTPVRIES